MGMPAAILQRVMTETEFHAHRVQLAADPDAAERSRHLIELNVQLMSLLVNSWGGKVRLRDEHLDPWKSARDRKNGAAEDRVRLWWELMVAEAQARQNGS